MILQSIVLPVATTLPLLFLQDEDLLLEKFLLFLVLLSLFIFLLLLSLLLLSSSSSSLLSLSTSLRISLEFLSLEILGGLWLVLWRILLSSYYYHVIIISVNNVAIISSIIISVFNECVFFPLLSLWET